jgi:predicted extracellular nuclease
MMRLMWLVALVATMLYPKAFKVASYNVENLFDSTDNGTEYEAYRPGRHNWTPRMVEIKLDRVAEVICDLDADVVALQEIENQAIFSRLKQRLARVGCPYR